jgi:hypothetical protein
MSRSELRGRSRQPPDSIETPSFSTQPTKGSTNQGRPDSSIIRNRVIVVFQLRIVMLW